MGNTGRVGVLVVEDDKNTREILSEILLELGYDVRVASSAAVAVTLRGFDLALLDLHLPDGNGLDVLKGWRQGGVDAPVVVLTADRHGAAIERAFLSLDAWEYLEKPFNLETLERTLTDVLKRVEERRAIERRQAG